MAAICKWHLCKLEDVSESEAQKCEKYGWNCESCNYLADSEESEAYEASED